MIMSTSKSIPNYNTVIKALNNRSKLDEMWIDAALRNLVYYNLYARIEREDVKGYLYAIMDILESKGLLK